MNGKSAISRKAQMPLIAASNGSRNRRCEFKSKHSFFGGNIMIMAPGVNIQGMNDMLPSKWAPMILMPENG